jgi:hypothetical protein
MEVLVRAWSSEAEFQIRYSYQQSQGKHVALNRGVELANGPLFLCFDSDTCCGPACLRACATHGAAAETAFAA